MTDEKKDQPITATPDEAERHLTDMMNMLSAAYMMHCSISPDEVEIVQRRTADEVSISFRRKGRPAVPTKVREAIGVLISLALDEEAGFADQGTVDLVENWLEPKRDKGRQPAAPAIRTRPDPESDRSASD